MKRCGGLLAVVVVAACVADDEMEIEAREGEDIDASSDDAESADARDDAASELKSEDDPALAPKCTYVVSCKRDAQDLQPVLVCDLPPLEPWSPWGPIDPNWPPLEPWTPLEVEPDLERVSSDVEPAAGGEWQWPPPGCHIEYVLADTVHTVECRNRCNQAAVEDCEDLSTGEVWSHTRLDRPDEFYDCFIADWEPCNEVNEC